MEAFRAAKRARLQKASAAAHHLCDASQAITLHLLRPGATSLADRAASFHPEFTHQWFPGTDEETEERIKGFEQLSIDLFLSPYTYKAHLQLTFSKQHPGADDLEKILKEGFPGGLSVGSSGEPTYLEALKLEEPLSHKSCGADVQIIQTNLASAPPNIKAATLYNSLGNSCTDEEFAPLQKLHANLQPLLHLFIDGASSIEQDDPNWELFLASQGGQGSFQVVGFATAYRLWRFPETARLRLSQVLVLPPFQRRNVGTQLMHAAYACARRHGAADLTMEDATPSLQMLRERVDVAKALQTAWLREAAAMAVQAAAGSDSTTPVDEAAQQLLLSREQVKRLQAELMLPLQQAWQVWEAVLYSQPKTDASLAALVGLIRRRLEGREASTRQAAESKRVFESEGGFIMKRWRGKPTALPGPKTGLPVALEEPDSTAEEKEAAVAEAVTARIEKLESCMHKLTPALNGTHVSDS